MTTYFDQVKQLSPLGLTDLQISHRINDFEVLLFDMLPWALRLPEDQQNDMILFFYKMSRNLQ